MEESSNIASNVERAIAATMDWSSSADIRKAAVSYLDSKGHPEVSLGSALPRLSVYVAVKGRGHIKTGDMHLLAATSFILIKKDRSSEIRLHGFKMLQHLVRLRWDEFTSTEKINFANAAINLMSEMVDPSEEWALKSQTAALIAEVVRREGLNAWQEFLPSLVSLSSKGPTEAEMVAMMLRWIPEDITVHNEDLEGDRRRELLHGLTQSLHEILPLLYTLLEKHFGAALEYIERKQVDIAKQHAATVTAALNAINAYAEWAPVSDLLKYGLIQGCAFLLSSLEFRLHACEFFKILSQRKRPYDDTVSGFDSAISNMFQVLVNVSGHFLSTSITNAAEIHESEVEFMECICETMVYLGSSSLHCISKDNTMLPLYLQQMLGYFQHFKLAIHFQSLNFLLSLMKGITSKGPNLLQTSGENHTSSEPGSGFNQANNEKKKLAALITDDVCASMLDLSCQRMLKKTDLSGNLVSAGTLELWSDDFDVKTDFSQYRSKLLELIRLVTIYKPSLAIARICERIDSIVKGHVSDAISSQDAALLECMQLCLETVINAAFDGSSELVDSDLEIKSTHHRILEGLLQQFLHLKWTEPTLVIMIGKYLDAFGSFLKCFPNSAGGVVNKLFELLTSLPFLLTDSSANNARHARLQICSSFIRIAKAADKSLLPHMRGIADTMSHLESEGRLLRGEHNLLAEAFLVMASSSGVQQQQEVLAWLLEPLGRQWTQLEWQTVYLSDPLGLVRLCSDAQFLWSIFHTVTFFEKALKRSGIRKVKVNPQSSSISAVDNSFCPNPMSPHLSWMLPPLLKLLRCINSLWSPQVIQCLPLEVRAAMSMSDSEKASLLGEVFSKQSKGQLSSGDCSIMEVKVNGHFESKENGLRNWLKGIRDSGYNLIGMSTMIGESFFQCTDGSSMASALTENVQSMEFRHLRQLIHLVIIPLVRYTPPNLREMWLQNLLPPLLIHCQHALSCSWSSLLREGRAKVPDNFGNLSGLDLKVEVMEEKLLRSLTREICQLFSVVASPALNNGIPPVVQFGNALRVDVSLLKDLDAFIPNSLVCFFTIHKDLALPTLRIVIEAFSWTDGDAVTKVSSFCGTLVLLAIATKNAELKQFVTKDLFYALIQSLTLESNAIISSELVRLCCEIFVYLSDRDPSPRQVLLSLPGVKKDDLIAFENALLKTGSPKEQKQHMKSLLLLATGNNFKALASQRSTNVITNVTAKSRSSVPVPTEDDHDVIGLAAIT